MLALIFVLRCIHAHNAHLHTHTHTHTHRCVLTRGMNIGVGAKDSASWIYVPRLKATPAIGFYTGYAIEISNMNVFSYEKLAIDI